MKRPVSFLRAWAISWSVILLFSPRLLALAPPVLEAPAGLSFAEIQITGSTEFVLIQNNSSSPINLGTYWLYNHNNFNPSAAGTTTSTQQLPTAMLHPGQTLLLSANPQNTCGAEVAGRLSLSLVDGISSGGNGGSLELLNSTGGIVDTSDTDFVSWYKDSGADIKNLTSTSGPVYYRYQSSSSPLTYSWQPAAFDVGVACQLDVTGYSSPVPTSGLLPASSSPPAIILTTSEYSAGEGGLPVADIGLEAPQISELLPNPAPPQADAEDEYIELYNPNAANFDLTGFKLEVGISTLHDYIFPSGTILPAKSFSVFYSGDTGLSMSNSSGQARLIDPLGNIISQSDIYTSAKDGQAWALANGKWLWTATPTPSAANIINGGSITSGKSAKSSSSSSVKGATTGFTNGSGGVVSSTASPAPIHPWTLVGVGAAALLYGGYEYRTDLANHIYKLRRYIEARRTAGK